MVCEALFTALEVALSAVSRARLRALIEAEAEGPAESSEAKAATAKRTSQRASRLLKLLERPERLTLVFITVTSLSLWAAGSMLTWQSFASGWPAWMLPLVLLGVLFVAEVLPLLVAARNPESIALRCVGVAEISLKVLSPLLWILGGIGKLLARMMGASALASPQVSEGELRTALREAVDEGAIDHEERAMLEGALDFRDKTVREVMTRRVDIVGVPALMPLPAVLDLAMREGHARLPVYESTLDRICGILATKDLIPYLRNPEKIALMTAGEVVRAAYFVPEHKRIGPTLEELRRQRTLMAVVVDADGGTAGLVTIEDLLEEIVGEIQDEYDEEEPPLRVLPASEGAEEAPVAAIGVEASVTVREVKRFWQRSFGRNILLLDTGGKEADEALSMAALALQLFDGVPQPGDRVPAGVFVDEALNAHDSFGRDGTAREANGRGAAVEIVLEVIAMNGPRIEELKLEKFVVEPKPEVL